ncbi:MbnP family protein [Aequorivita nionensis]|uniref:MbnP family protein n=1 Tax=Aequorivita nionensis TaxID=1287690 RepID=UPI003965A5A7
MKKAILLFAIAIFAISCGSDDDPQPEVLGCTDPSSLNYNPAATKDDGTCEYEILGCTDPTSSNYNPDANTDDGSCVYNKNITFNFTQNWDGQSVTNADFNNTIFTNEFGSLLTITKLRYLISRISLHKADGSTVDFDEYKLIDLTDPASLNLTPAIMAATGDYTGISFTYGFNEADNVSGAYQDLNAANWNWPAMLGGGYHFMQMEGKYDDGNGGEPPYAYHNGTARVSEGVFEQNFISFNFNQNFTITNDATIEIKMNIAEWYKNPYTWNLNIFNSNLMMNYEAQKHMNENGQTVFSIGDIVQ